MLRYLSTNSHPSIDEVCQLSINTNSLSLANCPVVCYPPGQKRPLDTKMQEYVGETVYRQPGGDMQHLPQQATP